MAKKPQFDPPWWLRNSHVQSCLGAFLSLNPQVSIHWQEHTLLDGDFVDLCWAGPVSGPIVVLLAGLEGSFYSYYIQLIAQDLTAQGWRTVTLHYRTCSGRMNRLPRIYHAGDTADLDHVVRMIKKRYPDTPVAAVGFSMGANVLLKYLAEDPRSQLVAGVAVSVPFEIGKCVDHIAAFYQWRFLRSMKDKVTQKIHAGLICNISLKDIKAISSMREFDSVVTAPLHGFRNDDDYYLRSSSRYVLSMIERPTLIMHSLDDPFTPSDAVPAIHELSSSITFELTQCGGHLGFMLSGNPWRPDYWLGKHIADYLSPYLLA